MYILHKSLKTKNVICIHLSEWCNRSYSNINKQIK